MKLETKKLSEIKSYENNPRLNDMAVDDVAESIRQCDYNAPIVVDENNVILAGHTRLKALQQLGYDEAEVIVKEGLTDEQKRKFRLLDNKTAEKAEWDYDKLMDEIEGLDFDGYEFGLENIQIDFEDFNGDGDGGGSMLARGTKVRVVIGALLFDIDDPNHEIYSKTVDLDQNIVAARIADAIIHDRWVE